MPRPRRSKKQTKKRSPRKRAAHTRLQQEILEQADAVIGVTPRQTEILTSYAPAARSKFHTITNGFDPVDFDAIDEQPVDLVFLLLAPEGAGADHLKALARVSRLLRDKSVCEKLRGADQTDAIYALLTDTAKSHAA